MKKEENIELEICCFFMERWILCWHNDVKGFYNSQKWFYQRNKNNFIRRGISDITALINWIHVAIEVKTPSEVKFFDKSLKELKEKYAQATINWKNEKKYLHALEQREFLDDVISNWWIWFFACSVDQVKEKLKKFNIFL